MVLVFHLNRRLVRYKFLIFCTVALLILTFIINTFEITYHLIYKCPKEDEPIDVVYTWVNGSDPKFLEQLNSYLHSRDEVDASSKRYDDKNELKFSLRSLEKFAPWIGHVYIVTNGQIPHWLNLDYDKVTIVTHEQIFTDKLDIPSFSSPAIESHLHRIPGLSKRFIYFNDDTFLRSPVFKDDFVSDSRGFLVYLAWLVPMCSLECSWLYVADGHCDSACNNPSCQMDGGDCDDSSKPFLGDVIVKSEDYQIVEYKQIQLKGITNYERILSSLKSHQSFNSTTTNFNILQKLHNKQNPNNLSELIAIHNRKVILWDKLKRRKIKKKIDAYHINMKNQNVDAYAASLQHTNRMLNNFYGFSVRKVPAHAPIMIDKDIMEEMQKKFAKQYRITSRNRFRSIDDVQFAFAYYYYVIHEKIESSIEEIFSRFDTDSSGFWSETEARSVFAKLYDVPFSDASLDHFNNMLVNCSSSSNFPSNFVITEELVKNCAQFSNFIKARLPPAHKYKFEIIKDADKKHVSFKMLYSNVTEVMNQLDDIRKHSKKFVCLNDNLDQSHPFENQVIRKIMFDFYISLFPHPSKFELPEQYKNRFLYMDDYGTLLNNQRKKFVLAVVSMLLTFSGIFLHFFRRKLCKFINKTLCY